MFHDCYEFLWSFIISLIMQASDEEEYDLVREGVVIFTGALAKHLAKVITLPFVKSRHNAHDILLYLIYPLMMAG